MKATFTIYGTPIAKKRPRFSRRGNFVTTYNSQETEEGRWLLSARGEMRNNGLNAPIESPVAMSMLFLLPIPASASKKRLREIEDSPAHTKKPDLDNLQKFALDCLNGELYRDDSQIYEITARKEYGKQALTEITVEW